MYIFLNYYTYICIYLALSLAATISSLINRLHSIYPRLTDREPDIYLTIYRLTGSYGNA